MDENRAKELAERAEMKGICTFSDFLNLKEQKDIRDTYPSDFISFGGGTDIAERKIARFGTSCVNNDFPISVLKIQITDGKFASKITHRDVLGALMGLQIAREKIGDIFVGQDCYAVLHDSVANFVAQNLDGVGKNTVKTQFVDQIPTEYFPQKEEKIIALTSNRLDAVLSKVFNLSREQAAQLIALQKVFVDGIVCEKATKTLKYKENVSVRGYGKFTFGTQLGTTRKGKYQFSVFVFC